MSDSDDGNDSEFDEISDTAMGDLKSGRLPFKDRGEIYFCPYCARKKSTYKYNELFRHAEDGGKGSKDVKYRAKHHALALILKAQPSAPAPSKSAASIQQRAPEVREGTRYMYPWKALVCNITTQVVQSGVNGVGTVGPAKDQLLSHFNKQEQSFNVESIFPVYNYMGQTDMAVVGFKKGLEGFQNAETFERSFRASGHGREEWRHGRDGEMYAWLLTKDHVETGLQSREWPASLKDHFKKQMNKGTKTRDEAQEEERARLAEVERRRFEAEKQREEEYSRTFTLMNYELKNRDDALQSLYSQTEHLDGQLAMERRVREEREKEIHDLKSRSNFEMERMYQEIAEGKRKQEVIHQQKQEQFNRQRIELRRQINDKDATNEEQVRNNERIRHKMAVLENQIRLFQQQAAQRERLAKAQQDEEIQKVLKDKTAEVELLKKHSKEFEGLIEKQNKKLEDIKDEKVAMQELQEELEMRDDTLNNYITRDRQQNDEIVEAHRAALMLLKDKKIEEIVAFFPNNDECLELHSSGMLDMSQWNPAFKKKYGEEEWEIKGATALSKYANKIYAVQADYFRVVMDNGKEKRVPIYEEPTVAEIKRLFGEEPMRDFLRANLEQQNFAPSASYSVEMVWNPKFNRKATLAEVVHFAKACCDVLIQQREELKVGLPKDLKRKSIRLRQ